MYADASAIAPRHRVIEDCSDRDCSVKRLDHIENILSPIETPNQPSQNGGLEFSCE